MKKLLAIILSLIIMIGVLPITAFAENPPETQNMELSSNDISLSGTNSVGAMLAEELEEAANQNESSGNVIYSVEIELNSAFVELSTAVSATLFVGVYTEDMSTLLTSGYTEVAPEDEYAFVELESTPPEYFYVKAYLVDTEDYSPLSAVHNSALYTQEMQEFLSKTTDDFEEEKVINFDDDKTNNFAVLSDEVVVLDEENQTNKVTFADSTSQIYIFENIDETISSLKVGDTFSFEYNGEPFVVKVGEISIDGTTATVLGSDAELEDIFDYVKLDGSTGITEDTVDESSCGEGITFEGYENSATTYGSRGVDLGGSAGLDAKFSIDLKKWGDDDKNVTIAGNFKLKTMFSAKVYISTKYKHVELKFDYSLSGGISVTGKIEFSGPVAFLTFGLPGIRAEITPDWVLSASGSVGITGTLLKGTLGYGWYSDVGGVNLCSTPKMEVEFKAEVTVFLGLRVDPTVKILEGALAETKIESNLGAEAKATLDANTSDIFSNDEKHDCSVCVEGEIYGKFDLSVKGELLKNKKWSLSLKCVEIKIKICDFYWSMTHGEFDFTTCPHISYKLDVIVSDTSGKALKDATVLINGAAYTTAENGSISTFLPNGDYNITASKTDYASKEKTVYIKSDSKSLNITLKNTSENDTEQGEINNSTLSLGYYHSAAITQSGELYMWGDNGYGQLGDGTTTSSKTPKKIMSNVKSVSLGRYRSAVITQNGDLYMWGYNIYGQLGDGTTTERHTPKKIMSNVKSVSLGYFHSAAITQNGELYMWGWNAAGRLGDGTTTDSHTPKKIMSNVKSVSLGFSHSAAITGNGDLYMWGHNGRSQLGDGTTTERHTPKKIMSNVKSVSLGGYHSAAITGNGDLYMWGYNIRGQLGDGTTTNSSTPKKIMSNVKSVSLGDAHGAAITGNGDLYMWGYNYYGRLGDGTNNNSFTPKKIMSSVKSVSLGYYHSAAITENGDLYMWGFNSSGQLGDGTTTIRYTPTKITLPEAVMMSMTSENSYNSSPIADELEESNFRNLEPNSIYNFYIMKDSAAENAFSFENLLYINQATTDENGGITFSYTNNGEDFANAEKFVKKLKNKLPDNAVTETVITANAEKAAFKVKCDTLLTDGYKNIKAKFTINGEDTIITDYTQKDNNLLFICDFSGEISETAVISVKLFADLNGITFELDEYHRAFCSACGDFNADGLVNAVDLSGLRKLLIRAVSGDELVFDPNGDGEINILDIVRLKKHIADIAEAYDII